VVEHLVAGHEEDGALFVGPPCVAGGHGIGLGIGIGLGTARLKWCLGRGINRWESCFLKGQQHLVYCCRECGRDDYFRRPS
jgi:hypothetical protein